MGGRWTSPDARDSASCGSSSRRCCCRGRDRIRGGPTAKGVRMAQVADEAKSGLDPLFDPEFFFDEEQRELRRQLIEICERDIRPLADANDRTSTFPRKSL